MNTHSRTHLSDRALLRDLAERMAEDQATTALVLAEIAEFDARQLYAPAYPSMFALCGAPHRADYGEIGTMRSWAPRIPLRVFCLRACPCGRLPFTSHSSDAPSGLFGRKGAPHDGSRDMVARRSDRGV